MVGSWKDAARNVLCSVCCPRHLTPSLALTPVARACHSLQQWQQLLSARSLSEQLCSGHGNLLSQLQTRCILVQVVSHLHVTRPAQIYLPALATPDAPTAGTRHSPRVHQILQISLYCTALTSEAPEDFCSVRKITFKISLIDTFPG